MEVYLEAFGALFERTTLTLALQQLPDRKLGELLSFVSREDDPRARQLGALTLGELAGSAHSRRRSLQAALAEGQDFDELMLEVLREVAPREVRASYLRAQLGGPRWKLRSSLERLEARGLVIRTGITSATSYRAAC